MKTCLIYGQNGLDLDVTINCVAFYKKLGFKVFFAEKLYDANLLVVLRAVSKPIDLGKYSFNVIHVYDYGGWDYDDFVLSINKNITYFFCTSEIKRQRLINLLSIPADHTFIALPPIDVNLWSRKLKPVKYNFVHIGNFKPLTGDDVFKLRFNNAITHFKSHLWGLGWTIAKETYHGKAGLFEVSHIYGQSRIALGLMYPFQREVTFSGRFWHAPLNGCHLLSEPGLYTSIIPGIIETDYSIEDMNQKIQKIGERQVLKLEAERFWIDQNEKLMSYVVPSFGLIKKVDFTTKLKRYMIYKRFSILNLLQKWYQALQIFKIIDVR